MRALSWAILLLTMTGVGASCGSAERSEGEGAEESADESGGGLFDWVRRTVQRREPYALDDVSRDVESGQEVECDRESLERHRGDALRYESPLHVHPAFAERLGRFERITEEVAVEIYGRAPRRIRHSGAFACRTVRGRETRLSEHALGNAVDVSGFSFPRLPPEEQRAESDAREGEQGDREEDQAAGKGGAREELPQRLRRPFEVTVRRHWEAEDERDAIHQRFLRTLTERLQEERVFRAMIGPSQKGHEGHLHLDVGPYRYVRL